MNDVNPAAPAPLLSVRDIARYFGVSTRTVWRWVAEGRLQQPLKVSPRITRWPQTALLPLLSA